MELRVTRVGGLITNCSNQNSVTTTTTEESAYAGGICGSSKGTIEYCCNTGNISGRSGSIAGIVGCSSGVIRYCYNTGKIYSTGANCGDYGSISGIVTCLDANVANVSYCYNVGEVILENNQIKNRYLSGIITGGNTSSSINYCYTLSSKIDRIWSGYFSSTTLETCDSLSEDDMKKEDFIDLIGGKENWKYVSGDYPKLVWE